MKSNTSMTDAAKLKQELAALKFAICPHVSLQKLAQRTFDAEFERDVAKVNEREMSEAFRKEIAKSAALRTENGRMRVLLIRANKWLRMIDERRAEVPQWLRHGADPHQLRKDINAALNNAARAAIAKAEGAK